MQNPVNSLGTVKANLHFFPEISATVLKKLSIKSENALLTAETPIRIREFTASTPKKSQEINSVRQTPFRIVINEELGYNLSVDLRCNGEYSYRIINPILFYTNVCGNISSSYERSEIDNRLKGELLNALQPALAKIAASGFSITKSLYILSNSPQLLTTFSPPCGEKNAVSKSSP